MYRKRSHAACNRCKVRLDCFTICTHGGTKCQRRRKMIVDRFLNSGTLMLLAVTHASRISTIIADALVVALTWVKTFQREIKHGQPPALSGGSRAGCARVGSETKRAASSLLSRQHARCRALKSLSPPYPAHRPTRCHDKKFSRR